MKFSIALCFLSIASFAANPTRSTLWGDVDPDTVLSNALDMAVMQERDPTVPSWAKEANAPLPPNWAVVSNRAQNALLAEVDPHVSLNVDGTKLTVHGRTVTINAGGGGGYVTRTEVPNIVTNTATDAFVGRYGYVKDSITNGVNASLTTEVARLDLKIDNATPGDYSNVSNLAVSALQPSDIVNTVESDETNKVLSAKMGKELESQILNIKQRGRYLSIWDSATGFAKTTATVSPYEYKAGDYFIVGTVAAEGDVNYKPDGKAYTNGVPTLSVETNAVHPNDTYYFDSTTWTLVKYEVNLEAYATKEWVTNKNYVTESVTNGILASAKSYADGYANQAPDYAAVSNRAMVAITNHQSLAGYATETYVNNATNALKKVAHSGSYDDLANKPTIPAAPQSAQTWTVDGASVIVNASAAKTITSNVQSDWNATSGNAVILNKPTIPAEVTESTVSGWGFTKNAGTLVGATANLSDVSQSDNKLNFGLVLATGPNYDWSSSVTYERGSLVVRDNYGMRLVYIATRQSTNQDPAVPDNLYWKSIGPESNFNLALGSFELNANKTSTMISGNGIKYPSCQAVVEYVEGYTLPVSTYIKSATTTDNSITLTKHDDTTVGLEVNYDYATRSVTSPATVTCVSGEIVTVSGLNGTLNVNLPAEVANKSADFVLRIVATGASQFGTLYITGSQTAITAEWLCDPLTTTGKITANATTYVYFFRVAANTYCINAIEAK